MVRPKKYTEEERKLARKEAQKRWIENNKDKVKDINKRYKNKNKDKVNSYQRKYRHGNGKDKKIQYDKKRKQERMRQYREYMLDKKCERCPCYDYRVLVWHHKDPKTKNRSIYDMVNLGIAWNTILAEIAKCECLCLNCHGIEHYSTNSNCISYQKYKDFMSKQKCNRCPENIPGTLSWHHIDPSTKNNTVSKMVINGNTWEEILEEIAKCECLCHKCHHIETHYSKLP